MVHIYLEHHGERRLQDKDSHFFVFNNGWPVNRLKIKKFLMKWIHEPSTCKRTTGGASDNMGCWMKIMVINGKR
jgi:hypothetical protein